MILKVINAILILCAVFMGIKQGYAMFSGKPEMINMFGKWGFDRTGLAVNGAIMMLAAVLILFPRTFLWGNFLIAAGILLIICFQLQDLLNLVIIYLRHPLKQ
ncbi:MAG: hypothetical protein ABS46_19775 [Cytophagaceae bacterium SCN 52-12]|nr:MAG: hypothetical protein ABS46_19775 [Cytophagaceae bacterium SCN 52-12]